MIFANPQNKAHNVNIPLKYNNKIIPYVKEFKYLGVIFDSSFTWSKHISYTVDKSRRRLGLLRALSGVHWGANKTTLLMIYRALIRSILLYGNVAMASLSKAAMRRLTAVQYAALQICAGAMKGTKAVDLTVHCGELPIDLQFLANRLKCFVKFTNCPTAAADVTKEHWSCTYGRGRTFDSNLYNSTREFNIALCSQYPLIEGFPIFEQPPWTLPCIHTDHSLAPLIDKSENPLAAKAVANQLIHSYNTGRKVFTDASLINNKAGIGILITDVNNKILAQYSIRLSDYISIYKAELHGIQTAIDLIIRDGYTDSVTIFTDSLSCVKSVQTKHTCTNPSTLGKIYCQAAKLKIRPTVVWIPSHVGIAGNEIVDGLARAAAEKPNIDHDIAISVVEALNYVDKYIDRRHQDWWNSHNSKYKAIQPQVSRSPFYTSQLRSQDVMMTRLMLGRCRLNAMLYTMNCHPTGLCKLCSVPETIRHFLIECSSPLARAIRDILPSPDIPLSEVLLSRQIQTVIFKHTKRRLQYKLQTIIYQL